MKRIYLRYTNRAFGCCFTEMDGWQPYLDIKRMWGEDVYVQGIDRTKWPGSKESDRMYNAEFETFFPKRVCICMKQGEGPPAVPVVVPGEKVQCGQMIGKPVSGLSVPVYASVSGTVTGIRERRHSAYEMVSYVVIESDGGCESISLPDSRGSLYDLKQMGIVRMLKNRRPLFLAGFYTGSFKKLCLAAFDREPMVYSDYRLLMECPAKVLFGARIMAELFLLDSLDIYVCHEEVRYILEKTAAAYRHAMSPLKHIRYFKVADTMYQKSCTPLIENEDGLWCSSVELSAVYDGFYDGRPMTGRGITVCGQVKEPKNLWVPNGTYVRDLLEYCGGFLGEKRYVNGALMDAAALCVVEGGPLGGHCVDVEWACVSLTTESLIAFRRQCAPEEECLMCRDCSAVCPVGLKPLYIEKAMGGMAGSWHLADAGKCVECGWCSYVCPAHRRLKEKVSAAKKVPMCRMDMESSVPRRALDAPARRKNTGFPARRVNADVPVRRKNAGFPAPRVNADVPVRCKNAGSPARRTKKKAAAYFKRTQMEMASEPWDYIELDQSEAMALEPLVPESQSGPYIHSPKTAAIITGRLLWIAAAMGLIYALALGPEVFLKAGVCAGVFAVDAWFCERPENVHTWFKGSGWKRALTDGLIAGMALSAIPSWKWILICAAAAAAARHAFKINAVLAGLTVSLCACAVTGTGDVTVLNRLWIDTGWMAAWLYMIGDMLIVPWPTVFFLLVFEWLCAVLGGQLLWSPVIFMGAVWFVNDYKNAGKDTAMHHVLAVFSGALCALLSFIFPGDAGVSLGLLLMHIIACNLTVDPL